MCPNAQNCNFQCPKTPQQCGTTAIPTTKPTTTIYTTKCSGWFCPSTVGTTTTEVVTGKSTLKTTPGPNPGTEATTPGKVSIHYSLSP